jgi:hypothetical protein
VGFGVVAWESLIREQWYPLYRLGPWLVWMGAGNLAAAGI